MGSVRGLGRDSEGLTWGWGGGVKDSSLARG